MKLSRIAFATTTGHLTRAAVTAGVVATLTFLGAGPAAGAPNPKAPCLATVFQAQAVAAPQTVSARILDIRELYLGDDPFGQVLKPLAQLPCSEIE